MHGDKSQSERSRVLESFLAGECPVLVCTALLGRGIDLPNVSQVSFQVISSFHDPEWAPYCLCVVAFFNIIHALNITLGCFILWKIGKL